jgi:hypothetical protein
MRRVPGSLAAGMVLSVVFFAYSWSSNHDFVMPILPGGYLAEALNRVVRFPIWVNQAFFIIFNGIVWGAVVFLAWSGVTRLRRRGLNGAT